ncbi:Topless-related protein 1 [Ananas comosus]|uniref:Topless-related protein 1 n=1 Tax=Ananas comosus TaxID=4615 RepID=A0A199VKM6_ANACO|nr:Topless-related protein 1 [Ananas comosus]
MEGEKEMQILSNDLKLFDTKDALTTPPVRDMLLRRDWAFEELKGLIEKNHDFEGKLKEFPKLEMRNLRTIFGAPLISTRGSRWPPALAVHRGIQVQVMECEMHELRYMNLGHDILALDSSGVHKIWKWKEFDQNASEKIIKELKGHHEKRVTGLAFSTELNVLISSGADAQLSKWGTHGWEHQGSKRLQVPTISAGRFARTKVQFHHDQVHLLVVHAAKLAIYDAAKLECLHQVVAVPYYLIEWCTPKLSRRYITHATYSCDAKMIIASFTDGCVGILTPSLELGCVIRPTAYLSGPRYKILNQSPYFLGKMYGLPLSDHAVFSVLFVYPLTIAAHPSEPMRFALGLSNGKVIILEPLESNRSWLNPPLSPPPPPLPKNTINGSSNAVEKTIPESR